MSVPNDPMVALAFKASKPKRPLEEVDASKKPERNVKLRIDIPGTSYMAQMIAEEPSLVRDVLRGKSEAIEAAKQVVRAFHLEFDGARDDDLVDVMQKYVAGVYMWRGVHPFNEQSGADAVVSTFWKPLRRAFTTLRRRDDIFMAGNNDIDDGKTQWVCNMGHFLGLLDCHWLGIPPTGKLTFLRYCEFNCVKEGRIVESCMHCDILGVMHQAGQYPLPPMTGAFFMTPGPSTHDGLLFESKSDDEGLATLALTQLMCLELHRLNQQAKETGSNDCPPEVLARTWAEDFLWFGPAGIGSTGLSIPRYQRQHQMPFRCNLRDKQYCGHVARFAEGNYACWFGWPNLSNKASGGFLGLPGDDTLAEMRVVDVYRREGDKLIENWMFMDVLHYLKMRGLDVLARMRDLNQIGDLPGTQTNGT